MSTPTIDPQKIEWFLNQGIEEVLPSKDALRAKLLKGDRIRVYLGVDPSGPTMHIGHAIAIQKLAELQALGHEVILLLGDFTAMIGDPTDKLATRKQLTKEQVLENLKAYKDQAGRFLKFDGPNPVQIRFNNDWLGKMSFADVVELAAHFTVQQMMERDMFAKRLNGYFECSDCGKVRLFTGAVSFDERKVTLQNNTERCVCGHDFDSSKDIWHAPKPVYMHEFFYPLMQGYDSVALDVDLEVGGNDQTFNMLAGRTLLREMKGKEKFVMRCRLLTDPTGKKMGKSEGNMISLMDEPSDAYGKLMSWTDAMIIPAFEILTLLTKEEIDERKTKLAAGENPITLKRELAERVIAWAFSPEAAQAAAEEFTRVHQQGERPEEMTELEMTESEISILDLLVRSAIVPSKGEARRQVEQKAVRVDDVVIEDINVVIPLHDGLVLQKGKRHFVKIVKK